MRGLVNMSQVCINKLLSKCDSSVAICNDLSVTRTDFRGLTQIYTNLSAI